MGKQPDSDAGKRDDRGRCSCPFCDALMEKTYPFCGDCGKQVNRCSECGRPISPSQKVCPDCKG